MPADDEHLPSHDLRLPDRTKRRSNRRRTLAAAAALVLVAALTISAVALLTDRNEPAAADRSTTQATASWRTNDDERRADARRDLVATLATLGEIGDLTAPARDLDSLDARSTLGPAAAVRPRTWQRVADHWRSVSDLWRTRCSTLDHAAGRAADLAASVATELDRRTARTRTQLAHYHDAATNAVNAAARCRHTTGIVDDHNLDWQADALLTSRTLDEIAATLNPRNGDDWLDARPWRTAAERWRAVSDLWQGRCSNLAEHARTAADLAASIAGYLEHGSRTALTRLDHYGAAAERAAWAGAACAALPLDH